MVLDSEILGTAINIDFYDKIQILSPFGPGNPEPKFVINSVRTLNSKIIGENHIKSREEKMADVTYKIATAGIIAVIIFGAYMALTGYESDVYPLDLAIGNLDRIMTSSAPNSIITDINSIKENLPKDGGYT